MSVPFTFPVSPDDFAAYQEQLRGEPIPARMREALDAWVPVFNDSYRDGLENDLEALELGTGRMDYLIERHDASPILADFLKASKRWIIYAWKQGKAHRPAPSI